MPVIPLATPLRLLAGTRSLRSAALWGGRAICPVMATLLLALSAPTGMALAATPGSTTAVSGAGAVTGMQVSAAWARAARKGGAGGVFLTLRNTGGADRLLSLSTPAADRAEIHTTLMDNGVMRMRAIEEILLPPGGEVVLRPGGLHLMLTGLHEDLVVGAALPLTLHFAQAPELTVMVPILPTASMGPAATAR